MLHFAQEWRLACANFALYVVVCGVTFSFGGLDPVTLVA
jgi:hypothetical protein